MLLVNPEVIKFMFLTSKYSRRPDLEVCIRKLNIWLRKQGEKKKKKARGKESSVYLHQLMKQAKE